MLPCDDTQQGNIAWGHKAINWTNVNISPLTPCGLVMTDIWSKLIYWWPMDSDLNTALTHAFCQLPPGSCPPLKRNERRQRPLKNHHVFFQRVQEELMLPNIPTLQMKKKIHRYLLSSSRLLSSVLKMFAILLEMPFNHFFGSVMWQTTGTKVKVALS